VCGKGLHASVSFLRAGALEIRELRRRVNERDILTNRWQDDRVSANRAVVGMSMLHWRKVCDKLRWLSKSTAKTRADCFSAK